MQNRPFQLVPDTFHGPKKDRAFAVQFTKPLLDKLVEIEGLFARSWRWWQPP